ncbi:hypothetical protein TMatcc_004267 [Talaromyces marneffei ATCC 18224]|uniref:Uncharacterized protein n=1 Tax=Talaromyces marneffei (strain ATCC 18224 / CBS 334.59 / QM 7333) TaxID=441960 RepID=B6Q5N2_TALMQ|nr:conserved hypothetical protein [Talaromyces marneffei ATCC 18224]
MALSDHITHPGASRRWDNKQQAQQDLLSPHLHRAHLNLDLDLDRAYPSDRKYFRRPSTVANDTPRSRSNFRMTRTLKDAFEATSRTADMDVSSAPIATTNDRTPSPRHRQQRSYTLPSPYAEVTSPPPAEILETYQRINDADDLADLVSEVNQGYPENGISRKSSGERRRRDSPGSLNNRHSRGENLDLGFSYLDDATDDYVRGKLSTYKRDEERLNRVTTSQSPVFSRARIGSRAEGLQRRESDLQAEEAGQDLGDDGLQLGLNVPKTWGNKSRSHRQWLTSITGNTPRADASGRSSERERRARIESRSRSPHITDRSPSRFDRKTSQELASASERSRLGAPPADGLHNSARSRSRSLGRSGLNGDTIPNTPITIYKSTARDPFQKQRSDSRELLRKLARTESPPQQNTPAQQKTEQTLLPQKTPVVIGAWVDTPMTVRNTDSNGDDDTKEIDSPSKTAPKSTTIAPTKASQLPSSKEESVDKTTIKPDRQEPASKPNVLAEKSANIDSKKQPKPELVKSKLPKSALETFIEDAKSNGNPLSLGDDTIASLEGLMDSADGELPSRFANMKEEEFEKELDAVKADTTPTQSFDKYTNSLDHLGSKLQSIIHSIQDARSGLNVIEHAIVPGNSKAIDAKGSFCETCGNAQHGHGDGRVYLAIPIPRLWKRDCKSQRLRPTYLGWATAVFGLWYILESIMCDIYCHPSIAEVCDGYCLQPDAPQFPFVLPTMFWRWSHLSSILTPIITLLVAFVRLIAQLFGLWDGYVDDGQYSDIQWPSSSSSYQNDIPIGSSEHRGERNGLFGLWSGGGQKHSASSVLTTSFTSTASMPTILQNVIHDPHGDETGDSIDDDEIVESSSSGAM